MAETTKKPIVQNYLTTTLRYAGATFDIMRKSIQRLLSRPQGDDMPDTDVNAMIWGCFCQRP